MSDWQRLSARRGIKPRIENREEITPALGTSLELWLNREFGVGNERIEFSAGPILAVAMAADVPITDTERWTALAQLVAACKADSDVYLDVIDAMLKQGASGSPLDNIFSTANSAWRVAADGKGLESRVDATATAAAGLVATPNDEASTELAEAWSKAYGVAVNASDAWDHAIKAVEAIYIPLAVGKKDKANLGDVAGQFKQNSKGWAFVLGDISTVENMIRLMWPNPDRHAGAARREPSDEESRAVVHLAVTLVQWARQGLIAKV